MEILQLSFAECLKCAEARKNMTSWLSRRNKTFLPKKMQSHVPQVLCFLTDCDADTCLAMAMFTRSLFGHRHNRFSHPHQCAPSHRLKSTGLPNAYL